MNTSDSLRRVPPPTSGRVRRVATALITLILALATLAACKPPEPSGGGATNGTATASADGLRLRLELGSPTVVGPATVTVHVLDGSQGVTDAAVEVRGDMSHAGMQPALAQATEVEPGVYRADDFVFSMAGDWIVTAEVSTADGREANLETFVTVSSR